MDRTSLGCRLRFAGLLACLGCTDPSAPPAVLQIDFAGTSRFPPASLHIVGGFDDEIVLRGVDFEAMSSTSGRSDSIPLAPAMGWPVRVAIVSPGGDTLGVVSATIELQAEHTTTVVLLARSDRTAIFFCTPILARAPLVVAGAVADTLWVASWGPVGRGEQVPVC